MNDNNESRKTVADIVAMLRKQSDEERALATRLRRTDDDVDFALASCYAEDAKYLSQIADRIEAAWKRDEERAVEHATRHAEAVARDNCRDCVHNPKGKNYEGGNAAAMLEALADLVNVIDMFDNGNPLWWHNNAKGVVTLKKARAALSAPARNCDRFGDELDAQLAFLGEVWLISVDRETMLERDKYENWTDEMRKRYGRWLLAPAAERKGEEA